VRGKKIIELFRYSEQQLSPNGSQRVVFGGSAALNGAWGDFTMETRRARRILGEFVKVLELMNGYLLL
jgi:hypothetical protein